MDKISKKIDQAILKGIFPGAVLLCSVDQKIVFEESYGTANIFNKTKMSKDSIFDLASLTKPFATTMAIAKLIEKNQVFLDQKIGSILEDFKQSKKKDITIDMLLRHTSGLPAYREYFKHILNPDKNAKHFLQQLLIKEPLENKINACQVYSDLGFMILSWIVEKTTNQRLDRFVSEKIYKPLDIEDLFFIEINHRKDLPDSKQDRIIATQECPWRKKLLIGEVDDDNAWAVGGIDGHAGLFGTAGSIHVLCCEILKALLNEQPCVLSPDIIKKFVKKNDQHEMVAGFDTPSKENSSAGQYFSTASIGHLGFTGTSFWIDPEKSLIVIFLTNRVHPLRSNEDIKKFRPKLHDLIYSELI